jgi:predicted DNA-binding transcriptional regulator AlpA
MPEVKKSRLEIPADLIEERVINIPVAAQISNISPWSMYDLIKRGKGPPVVRLCGRKIGVRIKDLKSWIASGLSPQAAE